MKHVRTRLDKLFDGSPSDKDNLTEIETLITLWCLINVPLIINFREFFRTPGLYLDPPPFINLVHFCFRYCNIFKSILSIKGILTNFCVPELH